MRHHMTVLCLCVLACTRDDGTPRPVMANDNRSAAGFMAESARTLRLELVPGRWQPDGDSGASVVLPVFAEGRKAAQVPGPLLRVPTGRAVRVSVRNRLAVPATVHGLYARPGNPDSLVVPPGEVGEVRFTAGEPGTYLYWASTTGIPLEDRDGDDALLSGAFVVDPKGAAPDDRVFVLGLWTGKEDTTSRPRVPLREIMTVNGRAWPHTERLDVALGDSVRWRVLNPTNSSHPMHLHGVYFEVERRGDWRQDTAYAPNHRPLEVTELMLPGGTMTMRWAPQQPGNWLFHCHFAFHVSPFTSLTRVMAGDTLPHGDHVASRAMAGLVLGVRVASPAGWTAAPDSTSPREIRLLVQERANHFGSRAGYGFVVQEGAEPARDSIRIPGTPLVLERGRPVRITVVNHLHEQTAVHWHGMELPSYPDGVPGWSGSGPRIMPPIPPGDSFVAEFTPRRSGTFIYHTHAHELDQMERGLVAPLLVVEPGTHPDPRHEATLLVSQNGPTPDSMAAFVNGRSSPASVLVAAGQPFRLRLVTIHPNDRVVYRLLGDGAERTWRTLALDGAELPAERVVAERAYWMSGPGMTRDVELRLAQGERLSLEVSGPFADRPWRLEVPVEGR